jgi:hypothetical protein
MSSDSRLSVGAFGRESPSTRLDSWKAIASYLNRHVTTVRRWEKQEGLPVHRHRHGKLGSIYAYAKELDAWFHTRQPRHDEQGLESPAVPVVLDVQRGLAPSPWLLVLGASSIGLAGREAEWRQLEEAWMTARNGRQQLVLITGEPGIGKTRLALEFARSIAAQATVLVGRCDRDALVPYAPFVEMLQWVARVSPPLTLQAQLKNIDGSAELGQLVTDLARHAPAAQRPSQRRPKATAIACSRRSCSYCTRSRAAGRCSSSSRTYIGRIKGRCCCYGIWSGPRPTPP